MKNMKKMTGSYNNSICLWQSFNPLETIATYWISNVIIGRYYLAEKQTVNAS